MSERFRWDGQSGQQKGVDVKVKIVAATLAATSPIVVPTSATVSPAAAVSTSWPNKPSTSAGATAAQSLHSAAMTPNSSNARTPIKLSSGTWVGISAIAVPTIAALVMGVLGIYDVKDSVAELRKDLQDGFEKTDNNFVQVRERVARLEAISDARAPSQAAPAASSQN